ncbi:MAG: 2-hydroxyglutaryl-CoA dehydratase, partial [Pygmaiobacter sp.]
ALKKANYGQIPVVSLNFSGLEKDSGFHLNLSMVQKMLAAVFYGDELMLLANQTRPYEDRKGDADRLICYWTSLLSEDFAAGHAVSRGEMRTNFDRIAASFAQISVTKTPKIKVGVVGEIYVKYSPLGNNRLEKFLAREDCEVNVPGLLGFVLYCIANTEETIRLYGGNPLVQFGAKELLRLLDHREQDMIAAVAQYPGLVAPAPFSATRRCAAGMIGYGNKMGEGWLLTAEMVELQQHGVDNIICAQPFGCLPNHICGKGMMNKIRTAYPDANIVAIDYDPSATRVNQENRIKLMLSVAKEKLAQQPREPWQNNFSSAAEPSVPFVGKPQTAAAK